MDNNDNIGSKLIIIDKSTVADLVGDGGKLPIDPDAEDKVVELLEHTQKCLDAIEKLKKLMVETGTAISPSFSGVMGKKINAHFKTTGLKFKVDNITPNNQPYVKEVEYTRTFVDSKKVEQYEKEKGSLPPDVIRLDQKKEFVIDLLPEYEKKITDKLLSVKNLQGGKD